MALKFFVYAQVFWEQQNKRRNAERRIEAYVADSGLAPEAWQALIDAYGAWPAGKGHYDRQMLDPATGQPVLDAQGNPIVLFGLRLCYSTTDPALAATVVSDIESQWDRWDDDGAAFYGSVAVPA